MMPALSGLKTRMPMSALTKPLTTPINVQEMSSIPPGRMISQPTLIFQWLTCYNLAVSFNLPYAGAAAASRELAKNDTFYNLITSLCGVFIPFVGRDIWQMDSSSLQNPHYLRECSAGEGGLLQPV